MYFISAKCSFFQNAQVLTQLGTHCQTSMNTNCKIILKQIYHRVPEAICKWETTNISGKYIRIVEQREKPIQIRACSQRKLLPEKYRKYTIRICRTTKLYINSDIWENDERKKTSLKLSSPPEAGKETTSQSKTFKSALRDRSATEWNGKCALTRKVGWQRFHVATADIELVPSHLNIYSISGNTYTHTATVKWALTHAHTYIEVERKNVCGLQSRSQQFHGTLLFSS